MSTLPPAAAVPAPVLDSPIRAHLQRLHDTFATLDDGAVATYIPELGRANPRSFGIAIATVDGEVYEVGDTRLPFTIQSISKPFVYGLALEHRGLKTVLSRVGVEPSGEAFNSISLEPGTGRPLNPMINAGAIATTSLLPGATAEARERVLLEAFNAFAGRELALDPTVYRSERDTGHRNRAIAHLLRNAGILPDEPEVPLDLYFRQCSIAVTCADLARMAACLAAGGVQPLTGQRVLQPANVGRMLSIMSSCGMYDFAGEWICDVGMPAKSGVAGGILAVLPGQLGIGVFSPPLDARGNSVRGIRVCKALAAEFGLHVFNTPRVISPALRASHTGATLRSRRRRAQPELELLGTAGAGIRIFELQGRLVLASVEMALRVVLRESQGASHVILDLERVADLDAASCRLMLDTRDQLARHGMRAWFAGIQGQAALRRYVAQHRSDGDWEALAGFATRDDALEHAENEVLLWAGFRPHGALGTTLEQQELCRDFTAEECASLATRVTPVTWAAGEVIMQHGAEADWLLFVTRGDVGIFLAAAQGGEKPLLRLGAGTSVGELALPDRQARSGTVRALSAVEGLAFPFAVYDRLAEEGLGGLQLKLLHNLASVLATRLRSANREIWSLK